MAPTCTSFSNFNYADSFYDGIEGSRVGNLNFKHSATFSILELEFDTPVKSVATQNKDIVRVTDTLYRLIYFPSSDNLFPNITFIAKYDIFEPNLISVRYNNRVLCSGIDNPSPDRLKSLILEDKVAMCSDNGDLIEIHKSEETQRLLSATIKLKKKLFVNSLTNLEIVFDKVIYILGVSYKKYVQNNHLHLKIDQNNLNL